VGKFRDRKWGIFVILDMERFVRKAITLRRDLSDVNVYDSGIESPELRWP